MVTYTENYNLKKPDSAEFFNVEDANGNMDLIDKALANLVKSVNGMTPEQIGAVPRVDATQGGYDVGAALQTEHPLTVFVTNVDTEGTPYAEGVTDLTLATIFSESSGNFGYQIAFMMGGQFMFMRQINNGVISKWTTGYLPLTGGSMSGTIVSANDVFAKRKDTTGSVLIRGGTGFPDGSTLALYGKDYADESLRGVFELFANVGNGATKLKGTPDGNLTWGAYTVAAYTAGTTDLTAGTSPLATGKLYFVYE